MLFRSKTTFPKQVFNEAIDNLIVFLQYSLEIIIGQEKSPSPNYKLAIKQLNESVKEIITNSQEENNIVISMRETQFYREQFNYLFSLAKNLEHALKSIKNKS